MTAKKKTVEERITIGSRVRDKFKVPRPGETDSVCKGEVLCVGVDSALEPPWNKFARVKLDSGEIVEMPYHVIEFVD